jgi:TRAP transporter TAXI family solute receptor
MAFALAGVLSAPAGAHAEGTITIFTGAPSGAAHALVGVLSQLYTRHIPNVKATAQFTKTAAESLSLLQAGRGELALASGEVLSAAWRGDEQAGFKVALNKLRGLSGTYDNYVQIVARADSGIRTVTDLKGKRVSVGTARSSTELNARAIVKAAGLSYKDFAKVEYLPFGQSAELMKDRQLDATLQSAPAGTLSIRDLANAVNIVVVTIPRDVVAKAGDVYQPTMIPANTYPGQTRDVATAAIPNFLVTQSDVSDELAYEMTKALYDNLDALYAAQIVARAIKRENAVTGMPVPLHPGAEKYYREVGLIK